MVQLTDGPQTITVEVSKVTFTESELYHCTVMFSGKELGERQNRKGFTLRRKKTKPHTITNPDFTHKPKSTTKGRLN